MTDTASSALMDRMRQAVGAEHVSTDPAHRAFMSQDIFAKGALVSAVAAPASTQDVARIVALAAETRTPIAPRGGGMSYTSGYLSASEDAVVLDLSRLSRVVEINARDMTVHVEAGATWADLNAALQAQGLRTPFWGPLSGISSTIGGGLSQNNAFFGAGHHGPTSDSVLSVTVVLANGDVVRTGSAGSTVGAGFFRHYGPDATGLFLGDCGAFGVKTEAVFRLMHKPDYETCVSFSFEDKAPCAAAISQIAREGLACELFGFDPSLAQLRLKRASLLADAGALMKVVGAQKSLLDGLKEGAKMAMAGRGFLEKGDYSLHAVAEGRSKAGVDHDIARIRTIALEAGGKEVENTIPKVIRANPFTPLNNVLGPEGERWAPVHGIVSHSQALACWTAIDALFTDAKERSESLGVTTGYLVTTLGATGFLIEPVFFWPDERYALHEATVETHYLDKLPSRAANPEARAHVAGLRGAIIDVFTRFGATHFQVGRAYPLLATRTPQGQSFLRALKTALDPHGIMNPGALGL